MHAPNTVKGGSNSFQQFVDVCEVEFCVITMFSGAPHTHVTKQPKTFVFYEHPADLSASGFQWHLTFAIPCRFQKYIDTHGKSA